MNTCGRPKLYINIIHIHKLGLNDTPVREIEYRKTLLSRCRVRKKTLVKNLVNPRATLLSAGLGRPRAGDFQLVRAGNIPHIKIDQFSRNK